MASHNCCFSVGHSHDVSCVHVQLREGWQRTQHAPETGKNILFAVPFGVSGLRQGSDALPDNQVL